MSEKPNTPRRGFSSFLDPNFVGPAALPPALAKLPPGRHGLPTGFVETNQRNRILLAALNVYGTRDSGEVSVRDLVTEAHLARSTFYRYFPDREACLVALLDQIVEWIRESVGPDLVGARKWAPRVRIATEGTVELMAADPRLARVCAVEVPRAGEVAQVRYRRLVEELSGLLRPGREERAWGKELPDSLEEVLLRGAVSLVGRSLAWGGGASADLGAELAELLLIPYLGAADAHRVRTEGRRDSTSG